MKYLMTVFMLSAFSLSLMAGVSDDVFVRGKIGNDFDDKKVKVVDSFGQTYYLARSNFPKDFKFKQGAAFAIEVPGKEIDKVKIIRKK